jgi:TPR repeat protein
MTIIFFLLLFCANGILQAQSDNTGNRYIKRSALVVAVNNYAAFDTLPNALNDGRAMARELKNMGFKVDTSFNPSTQKLKNDLIRWQAKLENSQEALFYFAGHGFSFNDQNYLVPNTNDFDISNEAQVKVNCFSIQQLLDSIERTGVPRQIMILDACRDYTKHVDSKDFGGINYNLKDQRAYGFLYATSTGRQALDGQENSNGIFTGAVLQYMNDKQPFNSVISNIKSSIKTKTSGLQNPSSLISNIDDYCFYEGKECSKVEVSVTADISIINMPVIKPKSVLEATWNKSKDVVEKGEYFEGLLSYTNAIICYKHAIELEDPSGYYKLGCMFQFGNGVNRDLTQALDFFKKGAEFEHIECLYKLGVLYANKNSPFKDIDLALKYYKQAAAKGSFLAMNNLGVIYKEGIVLNRDYAESMKWYQKSAEKGNAIAMHNIAEMYKNGWGVPKDNLKALEWEKKSADAGFAGAMNELGEFYRKGLGVKQALNEALEWYKKGADAGHNYAMYNLGLMYANAIGVKQNYTEALRWYKKAADLGDSYSMIVIGKLYEKGLGVTQDYIEAKKWYEKGLSGDSWAYSCIGYLFEMGYGVPKDYAIAKEWYKMGTAVNDSWAYCYLGKLYENGFGVTKSDAEAIKNYEKAIELDNIGIELSMVFLGDMYSKGKGVKMDKIAALKWYEKAQAIYLDANEDLEKIAELKTKIAELKSKSVAAKKPKK